MVEARYCITFYYRCKKNTDINVQNLPDICNLTCFANDYGFENYIKKLSQNQAQKEIC